MCFEVLNAFMIQSNTLSWFTWKQVHCYPRSLASGTVSLHFLYQWQVFETDTFEVSIEPATSVIKRFVWVVDTEKDSIRAYLPDAESENFGPMLTVAVNQIFLLKYSVTFNLHERRSGQLMIWSV